MCLFLSRPFRTQINYGMIRLFTRPRLYTKRIFLHLPQKHQLPWCRYNTIYIYGQLIYDEGTKSIIQWRKDSLLNKWWWGNQTATYNRVKLEHSLIPYTKTNSKQIKDSNPLQYSCLENPMDRGPWQASPWGHRVNPTEHLTLSLPFHEKPQLCHLFCSLASPSGNSHSFLPWGLCTHCSSCLECTPRGLQGSPPCFSQLSVNCLIREALSDQPVQSSISDISSFISPCNHHNLTGKICLLH